MREAENRRLWTVDERGVKNSINSFEVDNHGRKRNGRRIEFC